MALMHYLAHNAQAYSFTVSAAHLEHGIRGERSLADAAFVRAFCEQENIPLFFRSENCCVYAAEHKMGLEEGARAVRYRFFDEILQSGAADLICTAHHADDNAETLLFNLFRGSALTGAGGIALRQGKIVRPMLGIQKEEIEAYLSENKIPYVTDETNADTRYTRNFIRAEILPAAKKIFPACTEKLYSFSRLAREDDTYLFELAEKACEYSGGAFTFPVLLERPLFLRACVLAFRRFGGEKDYSQQNCEDIFSLRGARNGARVSLPFALVASLEYGRIAIYRPRKRETIEIPFHTGVFTFAGGVLRIAEGKIEGEGYLYLNGDRLPGGCVIRFRREGDSFQKFGGGTKKLKDYFIDKKIPARLRDCFPLIAKGNEIYAVCGVEISDRVKIKSESCLIYTIMFQKGERENAFRR